MTTLGKRIAMARNAAGLSQADLAALCGWDAPSRLANYEQDAREPTLADLQKIADNVVQTGYSYPWIVLGGEQSQLPRLDTSILRLAIEVFEKSDEDQTFARLLRIYEGLLAKSITSMRKTKVKANGIVTKGNAGPIENSRRTGTGEKES